MKAVVHHVLVTHTDPLLPSSSTSHSLAYATDPHKLLTPYTHGPHHHPCYITIYRTPNICYILPPPSTTTPSPLPVQPSLLSYHLSNYIHKSLKRLYTPAHLYYTTSPFYSTQSRCTSTTLTNKSIHDTTSSLLFAFPGRGKWD